jgi:hypothetical protein
MGIFESEAAANRMNIGLEGGTPSNVQGRTGAAKSRDGRERPIAPYAVEANNHSPLPRIPLPLPRGYLCITTVCLIFKSVVIKNQPPAMCTDCTGAGECHGGHKLADFKRKSIN